MADILETSSTLEYRIACHCGLASQCISRPALAADASSSAPALDLCHCWSCRKTSGLLCASYMRIETPGRTQGLVAYRSSARVERLFCGACGCHVFRRDEDADGNVSWAVATGVLEGRAGGGAGDGVGSSEDDADNLREPQYARHVNVSGTRDGGLSNYLPNVRGRQMDQSPHQEDQGDGAVPGIGTGNKQPDVLRASCHCGTVSFHVTRPDESSSVPKRAWTDLIHPYLSTSSYIASNPKDVKWWLRLPRPATAPSRAAAGPAGHEDPSEPTRYLAGTCACRSCRLTAGFEIQTWAFVPSSNIFLHDAPAARASSDHPNTAATAGKVVPLDFDALPQGFLKSYHSSPGVVHDFCAHCGASLFWRDEKNAGVVDISVGLLDAAEGARAEDWLDWWTERVSFFEEICTGRSGDVARRAQGLMESLQRGMRAKRPSK